MRALQCRKVLSFSVSGVRRNNVSPRLLEKQKNSDGPMVPHRKFLLHMLAIIDMTSERSLKRK